MLYSFFVFSSRRRHTRLQGDWSSDVCSSDLSTFSNAESATRFHPAGAVSAPAGVSLRPAQAARVRPQIGRASCRERGEVSEGDGRWEKRERTRGGGKDGKVAESRRK